MPRVPRPGPARTTEGSLSKGRASILFWQQRYDQHYAGLNVWLERAGEPLRRPGSIITSEQVMSDSELVKTEFYNDFLRPQQHFYSFGASIAREESVISGITALRSKSAGGFAKAESRSPGRAHAAPPDGNAAASSHLGPGATAGT